MIKEKSEEATNQSSMSGKRRPVNNKVSNFVITTMLVGILLGAGSFAVFLGHIQYSTDGEGQSEIELIEGNDDKKIEMVNNEIVNQKSLINQNTRGDPGEIGDSILDTLEFDTTDGYEPDIIQIYDTIYAIAYRGVDDDGFLKTVNIKEDGTITNIAIDVLEFDTSMCYTPSIIHISGSKVYAIAYSGDGDDGFLKTVEISSRGMITDTIIDTLEFDTITCYETDIIQISININENIYAIAYHGDGDDGFLKTVEIGISGQITDTIIDTLEFDTVMGKTPNIIHISGNVYAIAYGGDGDDGFLKTVTIATDGTITDTIIDTLEFDTKKGMEPNIIHISGNVYAITYHGDGDDGFLKTVEIDVNGQITDTVIDTLEFDTTKCITPNIIHISGNVYAIAYHGDGDDGFLKTFEIATNGQITDTAIDTLEFDTQKGKTPNIIHISGNVYAIAYWGDGDDGILKTVNIIGESSIESIDTLEFDTLYCIEPDVIHISGNVYGIAYRDTNAYGSIKTVEVASNGAITNTIIDTLVFDNTRGYEPNITHISGNVFAVAYRGDGDDGFLKTVEIATNGQITDTVIDTLEFDTAKGKTPNIIHISGNVYAIAYWGDGDDGFLKTVEIATNGQITDTVIDILEFDTAKGKEPNIIHISGNVYGIAYHGDGDDGFLKTVEIATNGQITNTVIDTLEFDTLSGITPNIIHINEKVYAVAYSGDGDDGFLKTVEIESTGQITNTVIDTLEFDTTQGLTPNIIPISGDYFAIAYSGDGDDGFLKIVEITNSGQITNTIIDSTEFDTTQGITPNIIQISDNVYTVAYSGDGDDGYLKSIEILIEEEEEDSINTGSFEFNSAATNKPNIIHISGNVYAIAYHVLDNDGFLKTVEIATNGQITNAAIDTLEFDTTQGITPNIIHISGNVYAIAYTGSDDDGFLKTIEIATTGQITDTVIDTLEFDTILCYDPNIILMSDNLYGVVYRGTGDDGFLKTIEIATTGQITDLVVDTLEFDTSYCDDPKIISVLGNVYAIAYTGSDNDGFIKTVEIATNGQITDTVLDTLEFDTVQALRPVIIHVSGNIYALVYEDSSSDGLLKTVEIASNGQITNTIIDELEFDTNNCLYPKIIHISGNFYSIVYSGTDNDGYQKIIEIAKNGQIIDTVIKTVEFDTVNCIDPNIIYISDEIYVIIYSGSDSDGYLKTVEIEGEEVEVTIDTPIVSISRSSENIVLNWNTVTGAHHYNIYRYSPNNDETQTSGSWDFNFSNPYAVTASTSWTDSNACNKDHANFAWKYYYIVRAVDNQGNEKKNYKIVGETSQHLLKGRNLIHWMGDDVNVKTALSTINGKYDTVQKWQGTAYDAYWGDFDYPSDFQLLHDMGYLVFIKSSYTDGVVWTSFENWSMEVDEDEYISSALDEPDEFNLTIDGYNIKLQWTNVTGAWSYNIYRTTNGTVFNFSNPIANTKKTYWIDFNVNKEKNASFSTSNYYLVRAVDSNGKEEQNFNAVGKISVHLNPGRNLIRWMGETTGIKVAFKSIEGKYDTVQDWNYTEYEAYWADWDWPNDYEIEHDMGYLIFIKITYSDGIVLTYIEQ